VRVGGAARRSSRSADGCALTDAGLPQYVLADHQRLKQVLINLLSNGIKYNFQGGELKVSC